MNEAVAMSEAAPILIVDDSAENRRLYAAMLTGMDLDIVAVASAADALAACRTRDFAMILLDVSMPQMDGFEAARHLRRLPLAAQVPIVFVSAVYTSAKDAYSGYSEGAVDYLVTPVVREVLRGKVAVFVDLYRLRLAAERHATELAAAYRNLKAACGETEVFNYHVAHDLRAPLRAIQGFAGILAQRHRAALNAEGRHYVGNIVAAAEHMERIIEDLLRYAQLNHRAAPFNTAPLSRVVAEATAEFGERARQTGMDLIPPADVPDVAVDRTLVGQILGNLIANALTYRRRDVAARAVVTCRRTDSGLLIAVSDNGIGIAPEHHEKIFKPFQRLHPSEDYPGTGIGLALVKKAAERLGGRVWLESAPGAGSTFFVELPLAAPPPNRSS